MRKIFSLIALCLSLTACGESQVAQQKSKEENTPRENFTLTEVALHANEQDCWMVLRGKVYNVTEHLPRHPGGRKITESCGKDVTETFYPPPDSDTSRHIRVKDSLLAEYLIGNLAVDNN